MAVTGSQIIAELKKAKDSAWQDIILQHALEGDVPSWVSNTALWPWVTVKRVVDGKERTLSYQVLGNYYAEGTDADPQFVPFIPAYAQQIADRAGAIMISTQMVDDIERGPSNVVRMKYVTEPLPNAGPSAWASSNKRIWAATPAGLEGIVVNGGGKKNVVVGPNLSDNVAIYGAFAGTPTPDGWVKSDYVAPLKSIGPLPWTQGYNSVTHPKSYFDHSHGVRFAKRAAMLDGQPVDLRSIFKDPKLNVLVSKQGPFDPRFPNSTASLNRPISTVGEGDDQGYAPIADDAIVFPRRFPILPLAVGAVAVGLVVATLRSGPARAA